MFNQPNLPVQPPRRLAVPRGLGAAVILATLLLTAGTLVAGPGGPPPERDLLRETLLEHRQEEAATKARLMKAVQMAEADATPNQLLYDARYYDLDLDLNPSTEILTGEVTVRAEVTGASIATLDLDLRSNMTVSAVTAGGVPVTYSHASHVLTVNLDRTYTTGEIVEVVVNYSGNPASSYWGWDSHNGDDMIWSLSEPYGARYWWPCKDLNSDKADSADIRITVPDNGLIVASNGVLVSNVDNGATRTFHWHSGNPIVTYLVSVAIHPYTFYNDWYSPLGGGDPMEVQFYVFPDHYEQVQATYALTVPMIGVFAQGFGEYPFVDEKYGHAEFVWGGGMEHQTCTSLGGWSEDLISHELAHQWWGDMITCDTFHHIWLNEGFAVWCEAYWKEQTAGFGTYQAYMDGAAYYGPGTIYVENPDDFGSIFDWNLSYNKASWVVHMVRGVLDDTDFFAGLDNYRALYEYDSATTEEFRDALEAVSGVDLDAFFQQWIYGEYFPVYRYSWSTSGGGSILDLVVEQIQTNTGLFTMPIDVRVTTSTDIFDFTVQNSLASQAYQLPLPPTGEVQSVVLDPDDWILCQIESSVENPTFDEGILLVNGVHWDTYWSAITSAYQDSVFWGDNPITFWDVFPEPVGGYPANLPAPLGHGAVPGDILGQYSTVIWVGNDYLGDLADWLETPIESYLEVGGNVLLMTRRAENFTDGDLTTYLGVTWSDEGSLQNCIAVYPGLVDVPITGNQSYNDVFLPTVGPESTLLTKDTLAFGGDRGTGVWAHPATGGTHRPDGAQFVLLCGRPYRMDHDALRANVEFILENFFGEPWTPSAVPPGDELPMPTTAGRPILHANFPNPFNPRTVIPFELPVSGPVELAVYDPAGRLVRVLVREERSAGRHTVPWDGTDGAGRPVASGSYFARLRAAETTAVRTMVLLR